MTETEKIQAVVEAARREQCEWCRRGVLAVGGYHYLEKPETKKSTRFACSTPIVSAALAALDAGRDIRAETGPMKFGDDWTGVFIRGDNALMGMLPAIEWALEQTKTQQVGLDVSLGLASVRSALASAIEGASANVQRMRPFHACLGRGT